MISHLDSQGRAKMVDISQKKESVRVAVAVAKVTMNPQTLVLIKDNQLAKGDVLTIAKTAAILAAKKTPELIPLSHSIRLTDIAVDFHFDGSNSIEVTCTAKTTDRTGVEMEALTAAALACLTIYDMAKSEDKTTEIGPIYLKHKSGGKNGEWKRGSEE